MWELYYIGKIKILVFNEGSLSFKRTHSVQQAILEIPEKVAKSNKYYIKPIHEIGLSC
jgi:hypothetical protein